MSVIDYSWDFTREEFSLDLDFFNQKEQEDKLWQAKTGLNSDTLCGAIETIIFMTDKPINLLKIKNQIDPDVPLRVVHESIARLQEEYEAKHHGIRLMEVAQGYQFRTKATYSNLVQKIFKVQSLQLSPTAVEVLAIIAYKQPISKSDVESIRGVDSSHVIRALMDRRLVRITGRSNEMGRPSVFGTTAEFLEVFNLNDVTDLPSEIELDEIANANEIGEIADIKHIVSTTDKEKFVFDEIDELDELSTSIREIAAETTFTKSLIDSEKKRRTEEGVEKKSAFDILEEHVNIAQVVGQNQISALSETPLPIIDAKSVAASMLSELLNTPDINDELEEGIAAQELAEVKALDEPIHINNDLEGIDIDDIELKADEVFEKSQNIIESFLENKPVLILDDSLEDSDFMNLSEDVETETVETQLAEKSQQDLAAEKAALEMALDDAFDELLGTSDDNDEVIAEQVPELPSFSMELDDNSNVNLDEIDLSDFVPAFPLQNEEITEENATDE
jgi:segregation and condensation protein B